METENEFFYISLDATLLACSRPVLEADHNVTSQNRILVPEVLHNLKVFPAVVT